MCPACGSSATLPFETDENVSGQGFGEVILAVALFFLFLFVAFTLLLLSRAAAPLSLLVLLAAVLLWRRRRGTRRHSRPKRQFVCLDCSRDFKA